MEYDARWAFNIKAWHPKDDEIIAGSSYVQPEEKERISRYVFQDDAKSSLIGRLMIRKFVHLFSSIPYDEIRFGRDDRGKPYLLGAGDIPISFNISHQGDFVVLAGNTKRNIGVDTMKIEPPVNKNIPEFFRLMRRQFSDEEWKAVYSFSTEMEQIACFYRLWCLKESYVKNVGVGITIPLQEISFSIKTPKLSIGVFRTDTVLYEKGVLKQDWVFEETLLDEKHAVAVSIKVDSDFKYIPISYKFLTFEDLVKEAKPLCAPDVKFCNGFMKKEIKLF